MPIHFEDLQRLHGVGIHTHEFVAVIGHAGPAEPTTIPQRRGSYKEAGKSYSDSLAAYASEKVRTEKKKRSLSLVSHSVNCNTRKVANMGICPEGRARCRAGISATPSSSPDNAESSTNWRTPPHACTYQYAPSITRDWVRVDQQHFCESGTQDAPSPVCCSPE